MRFLVLIFCLCVNGVAVSAQSVTVFAAASLRAPLETIARGWDGRMLASYAASSTLARQIAFGAPADLFLSANPDWANYVLAQGRGDRAVPFLSNSLIVAGPPGADPIDWSIAGLDRARDGGRIAVPLIDAVPLGQYTKSALGASGFLGAIRPHLAETDNAATARALLDTGTVRAAFLYQSDIFATALTARHVVDPSLYPPITYVAIALTPVGSTFLDHLVAEPSQKTFLVHGFAHVD